MQRATWVGGLACALAVFLTAACDDGGSGGGDDAGTMGGAGGVGGDGAGGAEPPSPRCVPDPDRVAAREACQSDSNCPCGTACTLGECLAECLSDADCADSTCNAFGKCAPDAIAFSPPPAGLGALVVDSTLIELPDAAAVGVITFGATGANLGPARVVADIGVSMRCVDAQGNAVDADGECRFDDVPADGARLRIEVSVTDAEVVSGVDIFAGAHVQTVTVRTASATPLPEVDQAGYYEGVARLVEVGGRNGARRDDRIVMGPVDAGTVSIPIAFDLGADGRARIIDPSRTITPHGEIFGQMAFGGGAVFGDAQFEPWHHAVEGEWAPDRPSRIACGDGAYPCDGEWAEDGDWTLWGAAAVPADGAVFGNGTLDLTLETRVHSINPYRLRQIWHIGLARTGDTRGGAPGASAECVAGQTPEALRWPDAICVPPADNAEDAVATPNRNDDFAALNVAHPLYPTLLSLFDAPGQADLDACLLRADCRGLLSRIEGDCGVECIAGVQCTRLCVERTLCPGVGLGDVAEPFTGDLRCADDGGPEWSHPVFVLDPERAVGRDWALTCLDERQLGGSTPDPKCFKADRWNRALVHGVIVNTALATDMGVRATDRFAAQRLTHRLVQQWFELDAAISRELIEDLTLSAAIDNPGAGELTTRSLDAARALLAGWDQILRPFPQSVTVWGTGFYVFDPLDYRTSFGQRQGAPEALNQGLPIVAADAMVAQIDLVVRILTSANAGIQGGVLDEDDAATVTSVGRQAMRRAIMVTSLLTAKAERARAESQQGWIETWDTTSRPALDNGMVRLRGALQAIADGTNPLGVSDIDVPASFDFRDTAGGEFLAISRFAFEQAQRRLTEAEESLEDARAQWTAFGEQHAEEREALNDAEARASDIAAAFGEEIADLCGLPLAEARRALDSDLNAETCYIKPECQLDATARAEALTTGELGYAACYAGALRGVLGAAVTTGDAALDAQVDAIAALVRDRRTYPFSLQRADGAVTLVGEDGAELLRVDLSRERYGVGTVLPITLPSTADADRIGAARALCAPGRAALEGARPGLPANQCETSDACPVGMTCGGGTCAVGGARLAEFSPACFRGELGRAALGIREARLAHQTAIARFSEHRKYYNIAMQECAKVREGHAAAYAGCLSAEDFRANVASAVSEHEGAMKDLRSVKLGLQIGVAVASAAQDCASAANAASGGALLSAGASAAAGAVECGASVAKNALEGVIAGVEFDMENAEVKHARAVQNMQDSEETRLCVADSEQLYRQFEQCEIGAKAELVGSRASMLEVLGALEGLRVAQFDLKNGILRVQGVVEVGQAELNAANRDVSPRLAPGIWLDEAIVDYQRDFARAQQVVYLAARAAEYETQKSIGARAAIIAAGGVGDLEDAMRALDDEVITPGTSVCGTAPNTLQTRVLSLRDDILALGSRVDLPDGWQTLSATDRLRAELASRQNAVFRNGQYQGQAVRFTLDPAVFAASGTQQCAERIWLLNIGLVGAGDPSGVAVELRQRNSFYSQRCDAPGERVTGVVRPSRNLYAVQTDFVPSPEDDRAQRAISLRSFPRARDELQRLDSSNGQSIEYQEGFNSDLAGRGLYGDYELMIPAAQLDALQLGQLQDILLRIDMVAEQPCPNR